MTGFGRAQMETPSLLAVCEVKALNGRYFEADLRLPKFLYEIDPQIRRLLSEKLERGTITCTYSITFPNVKAEDQEIHINVGLAKAYLDKYQKLSGALGVEFRDPIRDIIRIPEVIQTGERGVEDETLSCGTGVTAAVIAEFVHTTIIKKSHYRKVQTKGGELAVSFENTIRGFENIYLIGPAVQVFRGEVVI